MVDPNLHAHPDDLGVWSQDYGTFFGSQTVQVPTAGLAAGTHRLMFYGRRANHAAVMVVPFRVAGGC